MTQGERDTSGGELSSFLHLTGYRPLVLALIAGLAGAVGVFLALQAPPQFQARYVLNAALVTDNDATAADLDLTVEEIVSTASFPEVLLAVEDSTQLVFEDDYEIVVNKAGGAIININVVADDPSDAQSVAIETGIEAVTITTERQVAGVESSRDQLVSEISNINARIAELTAMAGGVNPAVALENAETALLQRQRDIVNPPTVAVPQPDGSFEDEPVEYDGPTVQELQADVETLSPIAREFTTLQTEDAALNVRLADRNNSIREARSAITLMDAERDTSLVIREVVTEETSRISGLLTGLLIFAVPATLLVILFFTVLDLVRRKPEVAPEAEDFDAAGEIDSSRQRALPESTTRLTVVDEDERNGDVLAQDDETTIIDVVAKEDGDEMEDDDDEPPTKKKKSKRSKDGRWGRDASSKAG